MVDFVRPAYLGSLSEFNNRFVNPILNGQCRDSSKEDVDLMRERAFVLHHILQEFVQRRDESVLAAALPAKREFVLPIRLSALQERLYETFLGFREQGSNNGSLFRSYSMLAKVWNHPDLLYQECQTNGLLADRTKRELDAEWARPYFGHDFQKGNVQHSGKMVVMMNIIEASVKRGERTLVFSLSLETLGFIERALQTSVIPNTNKCWEKSRSYFRLDGGTSASERQRLIDKFNSPKNTECNVFLLSTKAGGLGINLTSANRVIVMDSAWNPCHDAQAVCRVYRYGQTHDVYVYRLIAAGTMEHKIYERQIQKTALSQHVVDTEDADRQYDREELTELYEYNQPPLQPCAEACPRNHPHSAAVEDPMNGQDPAMAAIFSLKDSRGSSWLAKTAFEHTSLLVAKKENSLSEQQKQRALREYRVHSSQEAPTSVHAPMTSFASLASARNRPKLRQFQGWKEVWDAKSQRTYWYNTKNTKQVMWKAPFDLENVLAPMNNHLHQLNQQGYGAQPAQMAGSGQLVQMAGSGQAESKAISGGMVQYAGPQLGSSASTPVLLSSPSKSARVGQAVLGEMPLQDPLKGFQSFPQYHKHAPGRLLLRLRHCMAMVYS